MRKWSRAKHFADLIKWFGNNGYDINSNEAKDISQKINRHVNDIKKDFQDAQFVYACFYFGKNIYDKDLDENEINFTGHDEILNDLAITNRISALEKNHSFNKVRDIIEKYFGFEHDNHKEFESKYLDIVFTSVNKIRFLDHKYKSRIFLKFLYDKWDSKELTTRPFKDENKILHEILLRLNGINTFENLSYEKLNEINEFNLTPKEIDDILKANDFKKMTYI